MEEVKITPTRLVGAAGETVELTVQSTDFRVGSPKFKFWIRGSVAV